MGVSYGKHTFKKQELWKVIMLFLSVKKFVINPVFENSEKAKKERRSLHCCLSRVDLVDLLAGTAHLFKFMSLY